MNNSTFGKTMESVRSRVNIKLIKKNCEDQNKCECKEGLRYLKYIAKADFKKRTIINKNMVAIHRKKLFIKINKPIINGMCILDISKVLMYNFYYKTMKEQYGENVRLLFSGADSICFEVKTNDLYEDMKNNKDLYDFSEYPKTHFLYDETNKKRVER